MITLPITSITAVLAGVIILLLTIKVIQFRRRDGVVMGDGDSRSMAKAIRGHANAVEQLPIALILMGLAEVQDGDRFMLILCATALIVGRILHGVYFAHDGVNWRFRFFGMALTLLAQIGLLITLLITVLG